MTENTVNEPSKRPNFLYKVSDGHNKSALVCVHVLLITPPADFFYVIFFIYVNQSGFVVFAFFLVQDGVGQNYYHITLCTKRAAAPFKQWFRAG
jgi:hypothetical protein